MLKANNTHFSVKTKSFHNKIATLRKNSLTIIDLKSTFPVIVERGLQIWRPTGTVQLGELSLSNKCN